MWYVNEYRPQMFTLIPIHNPMVSILPQINLESNVPSSQQSYSLDIAYILYKHSSTIHLNPNFLVKQRPQKLNIENFGIQLEMNVHTNLT